MDFRQTTQPTSRPTGTEVPQTANVGTKSKFGKRSQGGKWFNVLNIVILLGVAIIIAAVALAVARGGNSEFKYVNQSKYQAVFLNNGQVYFGNIDSLNNNYLRLTNIYYLTQSSGSNSSSSNSNYSLVKLGCQQIHDPYDEMVINRDQVTFWENLQDSGKVVQSINQFKKQGVDCSQVSNQTQASSSNAQNSTNTGTGSSTANPTGSKQ